MSGLLGDWHGWERGGGPWLCPARWEIGTALAAAHGVPIVRSDLLLMLRDDLWAGCDFVFMYLPVIRASLISS